MPELLICPGSSNFREPPGVFALALVYEKFALAHGYHNTKTSACLS